MASRSGWLVAAGLLSVFSSAAFADAADRLDAFLAGLDTVSSRFEQRLLDEQRNLLEEARGTVLIDRPGRFRFEYAEPPQLIVGDGARVWIYDPELAQATVRDIDAALGSTPAVLLTSDRPVREWFRVRALDAREGLDVFALEPKVEDAPFTRIGLAFIGGGPAAHGARRPVRPDLPDSVHRHPAPTGHPGRGVHVHSAGGRGRDRCGSVSPRRPEARE